MAEYRPGACTIGEAERRRRSALGAVSLAVTPVLYVGVSVTSLAQSFLYATAVPLFGVAEGFYQSHYGFCATYGLLGLYDVSEDGDDLQRVESEEARRADRRRSLRIHGLAAGIAVVGALVVYGVGLLAV